MGVWYDLGMTTDDRQAQALSFGAAAAAYERGRPSYPGEAIDWLVPHGARRVLDLGAGTGKLTRLLRARGLDVLAVEPLAEMREQLARAVPGVEARAGTAEAIPAGDGEFDAVLVAQAWHWVDPPRAVPEVARVLAPGGRLCLLWNYRDERVPWMARLGALLRPYGADGGLGADPVIGAPFGPVERHDVSWTHHLDRDAMLDMVASRSYIITLPPPERDRVLAEVARLLDTVATGTVATGTVTTGTGTTGTGTTGPAGAGIALPYVAHCFRARLR
jgi:SAM-dependent methyltransferase